MELKLENALKRAKQERRPAQVITKPQTRHEKPANEWQPPVYDQSQTAKIDLKKAEANHCICALPDQPESDHYRVLRTQIQHIMAERDWKTVMVTSTRPGEGKTVTSINLAFAFAKAYHQTVLLVDCDFRRQTIHRYLGLNSKVGLIETLLNKQPLKEVIIWPEVEKLALISGSRTISESSELLASPMMRSLVREMRDRYADRYLFFDVPPILGGADAMAFAPVVDGILLVVGSNGASKKEIRQCLDTIPEEKLLGVVLNMHKGKLPNYYAYYR
ncbi:MAG: polysaccharide biosynthesis tyrosine autokinase [Desulfosarcinaceae bacterium]|nr:polysaccharide biosynthesis tyrosine autokinase [Desulfosarcinaceae bacterium]